MSSRWIISLLIGVSLTMAAMFYVALKKAPAIKSQITNQMEMEFTDYALKTQHLEQIPVAETATQKYLVPVHGPWKFEIRDKVLYVVAPQPLSETDHQEIPPELNSVAKKSIEAFIWGWVDEKFHSRKDLQLEVHFLNEPQAQ